MRARVVSKTEAAGMMVAFADASSGDLRLRVRVPNASVPKPLREYFRRYGLRREGAGSLYWSAASGRWDDHIIRTVIEYGGAFAYTDPWGRDVEGDGRTFAESVASLRGFARTIVNRHDGTYALLFWRAEL